MAFGRGAAAADAVPIAEGELDFTANVTVTYADPSGAERSVQVTLGQTEA